MCVMIKKVTTTKRPVISKVTIQKANERMINKVRKRDLKIVAQHYVTRKKLNPNEPLPMDQVVKVNKETDALAMFLERFGKKYADKLNK